MLDKKLDEKNLEVENKADQDLKKELELVQQKAEEYLAGWKRAKADYINLQKETEQKISSVGEYIKASILIDILPVYDNLKNALEHLSAGGQTPLSKGENKEEWIKGVEQIKKQFKDVLKDLGLEKIKTVGEKFNPERHEAIETVEAENHKEGEVVEEISSGYRMNGKVIRPARVKVAK